MDVLSSEPPLLDNPLLHAKNCIVTPHIAWATKEARIRLIETVVANLRAFLNGHTVNVVDYLRLELAPLKGFNYNRNDGESDDWRAMMENG